MLYASILGPLMQTVDYFETGGTMQKVVQLWSGDTGSFSVFRVFIGKATYTAFKRIMQFLGFMFLKVVRKD